MAGVSPPPPNAEPAAAISLSESESASVLSAASVAPSESESASVVSAASVAQSESESPSVSASVEPTEEENAIAPAAVALFVGDLHPEVTEAVLEDVFSRIVGTVSVRVCKDTVSGNSLGHGYVNYMTREEAIMVIEKMNNSFLYGRRIRVTFSCRDPDTRRDANVFTKNLAESIDDTVLFAVFGDYGNVLSCRVALDHEGRSKGYGFVQYDIGESANAAIEALNGRIVGGKQLYVGRFLKRHERMPDPDAKYTNLYLKNLAGDITEEFLRLKFSEFGSITNLAITRDARGKSRGFGFVNFENPDHAKRALEAMNGVQLGTAALYVARAQKKAERQLMLQQSYEEKKIERMRKSQSNLYVKNISDSVDDETLKSYFSPHGFITSAKVMRTENGINKGFGFVCFSALEEAAAAIKALHGKMFHGKPLFVGFAQTKENRKLFLQMQFGQNIAPLTPIVPPGYHQYYYAPPPAHPGVISHAHPSMVPTGYPKPFAPYGVRPGWGGGPNGYASPARAPFQNIPALPAVPNNHPRQHYRQNRGRGGNGGGQAKVFNNNNQRAGGGQVGQTTATTTSNGRYQQGESKGTAAPISGGGGESNVEIADIAAIAKMLDSLAPEQQKRLIGEHLFSLIEDQMIVSNTQPNLAAKITGMLLEMENSELLVLLDSSELLSAKVEEAMKVLQQSQVIMGSAADHDQEKDASSKISAVN